MLPSKATSLSQELFWIVLKWFRVHLNNGKNRHLFYGKRSKTLKIIDPCEIVNLSIVLEFYKNA